MSKIAGFAAIDHGDTVTKCRALLRECRRRMERMVMDKQYDGADREVMTVIFRDIDRALDKL